MGLRRQVCRFQLQESPGKGEELVEGKVAAVVPRVVLMGLCQAQAQPMSLFG